jgi:hypothetical protein
MVRCTCSPDFSGVHRHFGLGGQQFLGFARFHHQQRGVFVRQRRQLFFLMDVAEQAVVEVVAAQRGIAAGGQHFKHALAQLQDRDIEGAAAQIVDGVDAFRAVIQAVGDGGRRRLAQQAQHVQAGQLGRILGGLALGVVEVGRHGDDRAHQIVAQRIFRALAQRGQDLRRHFHRALHAGDGLQLHHARRINKSYGRFSA